MKRIYITGGIGTGKSTATKVFKENGFSIISADIIAEDILKENTLEIKRLFNIKENEFKEFKKELSSKVFNNKEDRKKLESIVLPKILDRIETNSLKYESDKVPFVIEAPTYFEVRNMKKGTDDLVILITTEKETKIDRIKKRNPHLSIEDINKRIDSQIDDSKKEPLSDYIVNNDNLDLFKAELQGISENIKDRFFI